MQPLHTHIKLPDNFTDLRNHILDQIPEAVFTIGVDGSITYFNQACVDLAGRTPLIGRDAWCAMWKIYDENGVEVAPEESAVATSLHTQTPMRGGELTGERPDGSRFQFIFHTTPLFEDGALTGALALLIDVTARKQAETKLRQLEAEVTYLSRVAAMGAMGSVLVHELSQPLTAARNYIQTSDRLGRRQEPAADPAMREALQAAEAAIVRASDTLKSLKQMVQRKPGQRKKHSLAELVGELAHLLPGSLALACRIDAEADEIFADKVQIEQVLFNLVRNAREATEGMADAEIAIQSRRIGDTIEVCVVDNGPGVPKAVRDSLFSPFRSSKSEGMGIGLSICRAIVEQHGGRIWLASNGAGAKFCFTLPLVETHVSALAEPD
jgi:two-component system sensor kinase FixL